METIHVIDQAVSPDTCATAASILQCADPSQFDTYDNPFESKQVWRNKYPVGVLGALLSQLEHQVILANVLLGRHLTIDASRYYASIFRYGPGSRLDVHVDAGICPRNGLRKAATAILYLNDVGGSIRDGEGDLEFWRGSSCVVQAPAESHYAGQVSSTSGAVWGLKQTVRPYAGRLVLFENHDSQWHGMTPMSCNSQFRAAITVSYLTEDTKLFGNQRRRAYFVPRPDQQWTEEHYRLRDMRADKDKAAEVYRVGAGG